MKKRQPVFAMALSALLFAGFAHANVSETGRITKIIVEGDHLISFNFSGPDATGDCANGGRWTLNRNDDPEPQFKEKYAAILAAAAGGQEVTFFHLAANGCGDFNSNRVYFVEVNY